MIVDLVPDAVADEIDGASRAADLTALGACDKLIERAINAHGQLSSTSSRLQA
jgi:hypothetical protein